MKPIQSIKAIQYRAYGAYAENRFVDLPAPAANDGQVLVRMRTVGINPLDNTFRSGHHYAATPENLPRVGGQMGAGVVVDTKSPSFKVGDRVFVTGPGFGVIADGTWRELVTQLARTLDARHAVSTTTSHAKAAEARRYLVEGRPFGRVLLTI